MLFHLLALQFAYLKLFEAFSDWLCFNDSWIDFVLQNEQLEKTLSSLIDEEEQLSDETLR